MSGKHSATATLTVSGTPYTLDVREVEVTLDDAWEPYGQVSLECWTPSKDVLDLIDPRTPGLRLTVTLTDGTFTRTFNVGLRSRSVDHITGTMTITGATDEALLQDYVRVATNVDSSAAAYQSNLRTLINNIVLAPIGAVLQTDMGATADLTIWADQTNLIANPSAEVDTVGWTGSGCTLTRVAAASTAYGANAFRLATPTTSASYMTTGAISVTPGATYVLRGSARANVAGTGTPNPYAGRMAAVVFNTNTALGATPPINNASASWQDVSVSFTIPGDVTEVQVRCFLGYPTAANYDWDGLKLALVTGSQDIGYFDGSTPTLAGKYTYAWTGTAHASTSVRTNITGTDRSPEMFRWIPGESLSDFAEPLVQAGGLRLFCDELRKWHLVDPARYTVPGLIPISEGKNAVDATDTISRDAEWFDAVVIAYQWTTADGLSHTRWDYATTPGWSKTYYEERLTPWPGPGAAAALLIRTSRRGRVLDLEAVSDYHATPGMGIQALLPSSPEQQGILSAVTWTQPGDEMTVTSRGLQDVVSEAWLHLPIGEKWTDSPVGASWVSEPV